jgi:hypothetical protein
MTHRTADPLLQALAAPGPDPAAGLELFARFTGAWDVVSTRWRADGTPFDEGARATWTFGLALRGRAILDVLDGAGVFGLSVRSPHADGGGAWSVSWHAVGAPHVFTMTARAEGDRIVLRGEGPDGLEEWSFNEVSDDAFVWRSRVSPDGGASWYVDQEMRCTRQDPLLAPDGTSVRHSTV